MEYRHPVRHENTDGVDGPGGGRIPPILVGALVGALVVGLAWLGQSLLTSDEAEPDQDVVSTRQPVDDEATGDDEDTGDEVTAGDAAPSHLERCQLVYDAQSGTLQTSAESLSQWEVHIGAMNKLVVGAITLDQAWQFWNQTRVGAFQKLEAFAAAHQGFGQRIFRCPAPNGSAEASRELSTCFGAVAARTRAIHLAAVALDTWERHVHHMEMLRGGEMTPEEATRLWLQSWRQGDREVRAYRDAARATQGKAC